MVLPEILFIDPSVSTGFFFSFESFVNGLTASGVNPASYNITYKQPINNSVAETKKIVTEFLDAYPDPDALICSNSLVIVVLTSNQLVGAVEALRDYPSGSCNYVDNCLIVSDSSLNELPGQGISLAYSVLQEVQASIIHQKMHEIEYVIVVYEQDDRYTENYIQDYEKFNLAKKVIYLPYSADVAREVNRLIRKLDKRARHHFELLAVLFTENADNLLSKIKYKRGIRALACEAASGLNPQADPRFPIMSNTIAPLDITESTKRYYRDLLPNLPSGAGPAYFDAGIQIGSMIRNSITFTVVNFCNRITQYYELPTAQYGGDWIDQTAKRSVWSAYYFIYTYDPIMGPYIPEYRARSPWMPSLVHSAAVPYKINKAFWVRPKGWIIYYQWWRYFDNLEVLADFLRLYLGIDSSTDTKDVNGDPFYVTGYAAPQIPIYFVGDDIPIFQLTEKFITEYPFQEVRCWRT